MIAANKRLLNVTAKQGVLGIQENLIQLYQSNLSAIATQAALIAGFAFSSLQVQNTSLSFAAQTDDDQYKITVENYFWLICFTICLVTALWVLSQATIVVMFGPSMALKSKDEQAIIVAQDHMRDQQYFVFQIAAVSITSLFIGAMIQTWTNYPTGIASICTCCYIIGYGLLAYNGHQAYCLFYYEDVTGNKAAAKGGIGGGYEKAKSSEDSHFSNPSFSLSAFGLGGSGSKSSGGGGGGGGDGDKTAASANGGVVNSDVLTLERKQELRDLVDSSISESVLFVREAAAKGGGFTRKYVVLANGRLDFYKTEEDRVSHRNPLTKKPIKLYQYRLELDTKKIKSNVINLSSNLKAGLLGNRDFSVQDILSSKHNLEKAYDEYRFALVPHVSDELASRETFEMVAETKDIFDEWTQILATIIDAYDTMRRNVTVDETMRTGVSSLAAIVHAANYEDSA